MNSSPETVSVTTSRETSGVDKREVYDVLAGNLSLSHYPVSRNIRIFLSSEWSDTVIEKDYISKHAIPKLRQFCQSQGLQFHAVDFYGALPRHCITPEAADIVFQLEREGVLKLTLEEIKLCQRISAGPNFVTLLAQKYGHKPLHTVIPEEDFTLLVAVIEDPASRELVHEWYRLDTNSKPCQYVLQLPGGQEKKSWSSIHNSLSKMIRKAAKIALGKNVSKAQHYIMSAVEQEVSNGIFNLKQNPNFTCCWMKRTFTDLLEQNPLNDVALVTYSDLKSGKRGLEFDSETMKALNHLKEARLPAKYIGLDATNIHEFSLQWQKNKGLDPDCNPAHSEYLVKLGDVFVSTLCASIADCATLFELQEYTPVYHEALCHGTYAKEKAQNFWNRPEIISNIDQYIVNSSSCQPLVVHGSTGSGKTCIMANAAYRLREKFPLKKMVTIVRFLGTTPYSTNIRNTLRSVCEQLCAVYQEDPADIPGDYKSISKRFITLLSKATASKPLVLFLDGVDQLSSMDGASGMSWLPLTLPPHVKIVLSTSSEVQYRCYPVLQSLLYKYQECFVEVPSLTLIECRQFLRHSLEVMKRQLTPKQEDVASRAFHQCPLPLYLQFLMKEISTWCSYTTDIFTVSTLPSATLHGITEVLFKSLETKYGQCFVRHALGYITASKHGLTELEILDILACDSEVMIEVIQQWKKRTVADTEGYQLTCIPPMLWSQLYHSLLPFLEIRMGAGGYLVYCWSHRHLKECAEKHFLTPEVVAREKYSKLAEYFSGYNVAREASCHTAMNSEDSSSELAASSSTSTVIHTQPLILNNEKQLYNVRKLVELPNSLAKCGRIEELQSLLTDYSWLKASVHTMSCSDVIEYFSAILPLVPVGRNNTTDETSHEVRLLRDALKLSVCALNSDSTHLTTQLLGRLMPYVTDTNEDDGRHMLKNIVVSALEDNHSLISPLQSHFHIPGGPLFVTMEGHRDVVSGIDTALVKDDQNGELSLVVVTSSWDKTLKSWDLKTTGVLKTFDGHTDKVLCVALTDDGQYAVSGSADKTVRHWFVPTGEVLYTMAEHTAAVNVIVVTGDGCKTISGSSDSTIKFWNTDISSSSCGQLIFTVKDIHSPVLALSLSQDLELAVGCKNGTLSVINTVSASITKVASDREGAVTALTFVNVDNCLYLVSGSEDGVLRVRKFGSSGSQCLHLLEKPTGLECGPIRTISAGTNGKIVASYSNETLSVYDLKSGQHLFELRGHHGVIFSTKVTDGGSLAFLGACDHSIHVWDLLSSPALQSTLHHSGNVNTVAISSCETYGVSAGDDAIVKIYDLEGMKVLREISTNHGGSINDILLMRDAEHLITASADGAIQVWNGQRAELEQTLQGHESGVNCIALTPDSELLMSGGDDNKIIFWSIKTGENLRTFTNHLSAIVALHFAKNPKAYYMISASKDGIVCVRDFYTASILLSKKTQTDDLVFLAVSSHASFVVTGSKDGSCQVLNLPDGKLMSTLVGHRGPIRCVNILPDNSTCLTASEDCTLRMWDTSASECLAIFHTDLPILSCDISFHGNTILFGTSNGCVSTAFYQTPTEQLSPREHPVLKSFQGIVSHPESPLSEEDTSSINDTSHSIDTLCDSNLPHNESEAAAEQESLARYESTREIEPEMVADEELSHAIDVEVKVIFNTQQNLSSSSIDLIGSPDEHRNGSCNGGVTVKNDINALSHEETDGQVFIPKLSGKNSSEEDVGTSSTTDNLASGATPRSTACNIV